jgi:intracellular septation protein
VSARAEQPGLRLAIDYLPLLVFFAITFFAPAEPMRQLVAGLTPGLADKPRLEALLIARAIVATAAFVLATVVAMVVSRVKLGTVSPMLWISGVLVVVFGGLTVWFADPKFIQMKPTFVYAILAAVLGFGLATGRPLLQLLLGSAYPGLSERGWRLLTINWTGLFAALAVANEVARAALSYDAWVLFKFPGCALATLAFAFANVPMLLRNGLMLEPDGAAANQLPPE